MIGNLVERRRTMFRMVREIATGVNSRISIQKNRDNKSRTFVARIFLRGTRGPFGNSGFFNCRLFLPERKTGGGQPLAVSFSEENASTSEVCLDGDPASAGVIVNCPNGLTSSSSFLLLRSGAVFLFDKAPSDVRCPRMARKRFQNRQRLTPLPTEGDTPSRSVSLGALSNRESAVVSTLVADRHRPVIRLYWPCIESRVSSSLASCSFS